MGRVADGLPSAGCGDGHGENGYRFPHPGVAAGAAGPPHKGEVWSAPTAQATPKVIDLAFERPGAALLAAGSALYLAHEGAEGERIGEMPAHSALPVAEGRDRLDHAGEPP